MLNTKHFLFGLTTASVVALLPMTSQAISLRDAVAHTVQTNPKVLYSVNTERAYHEGVGIARSGYLPKLNLNMGAGGEDSLNSFNNFHYNSLERTELSATLVENVFNGFDTTFDIMRNKNNTNAQAYDVYESSEAVGLSAVESYLNVLRDRQLVKIRAANVAAHRKILSKVELLQETGVGREADISQTMSRLKLAQANYYSAQNN